MGYLAARICQGNLLPISQPALKISPQPENILTPGLVKFPWLTLALKL
jgi:hypothetical protein